MGRRIVEPPVAPFFFFLLEYVSWRLRLYMAHVYVSYGIEWYRMLRHLGLGWPADGLTMRMLLDVI